MPFDGFGKLLVLAPLFVALFMVAWHFHKAFKAHPMSAVDKAEARASIRALVYLFVALTLAMWLVPSSLGGVGTTFGVLLSSILAMTIVLSLVELPARLSRVDTLLWKDAWKTPGYSRTKNPVPYVRWGRRFAMVLFVLFVFTVALWGGSDHGQVLADEAQAPPAATDTQTTTSTTPTTPPSTPEAPASGSTEETVTNTCGGPNPTVADQPTTIPFGKGNLQICHNEEWQSWTEVNPGKAAPKTVSLRAWTTDATYGYGEVVTADRTSYLIRTTDF